MGKSKEKRATDPRVEGIGTVGGIALAALGISIPLTVIAGRYTGWLAAAIPLAIIFGAGILSIRIWSTRESQVNRKENDELKSRLQNLEERLANLEMVDSLEAHFAERHRHPGAPGLASPDPSSRGPARTSERP